MVYDPIAGLLARQHDDVNQPEEPTADDILSRIGRNSLNGLGYVGSVLDKPGRSVRGLLGGNLREGLAWVPFSDAIGLTDPDQQISGRDLLEKAGIAGENKPGLFNDLGDFAGDVGGFGVELATDPLTYLGGLGAYTKAGQQSLKAFGKAGSATARTIASTVDDAAKAAARAAHPEIAKAIDSGVAPLAETLGGRIRAGQASLASAYVPKYGLFGGPLGGEDAVKHFGTGEAAAKFADSLGDAADYLKYHAPVTSNLASLFSAGMQGMTGAAGKLADAKNAEAAGNYADVTASMKPMADQWSAMEAAHQAGTLPEPSLGVKNAPQAGGAKAPLDPVDFNPPQKLLTHLNPKNYGAREGDILFQSARDQTDDFFTPTRHADETPPTIATSPYQASIQDTGDLPEFGEYNPLAHASRRAINGGDTEADLANMLFGKRGDPIHDLLHGGQELPDELAPTVIKGATPTADPAKTIIRPPETSGVDMTVNGPGLHVHDPVDPFDAIPHDPDAAMHLIDEDFAKGPMSRPDVLFQGGKKPVAEAAEITAPAERSMGDILKRASDIVTELVATKKKGTATGNAIMNALTDAGMSTEDLAAIGMDKLRRTKSYGAEDVLDHIANTQAPGLPSMSEGASTLTRSAPDAPLPETIATNKLLGDIEKRTKNPEKLAVKKAELGEKVGASQATATNWGRMLDMLDDNQLATLKQAATNGPEALRRAGEDLIELSPDLQKAMSQPTLGRDIATGATLDTATKHDDIGNVDWEAMQKHLTAPESAPVTKASVQAGQAAAKQSADLAFTHTVPSDTRQQFLDVASKLPAVRRLKNGGQEAVDAVLSLYDRAYGVVAKSRGINKDDIWKRITATAEQTKNLPEDLRLQAAAQEGKGFVQMLSNGERAITALEKADVSTFVHELGHVLRKELDPKELDTISDWLATSGKTVHSAGEVRSYLRGELPSFKGATDIEENYARAVEEFFRTNKAPTPALKSVFARMKQWMSDIYKRVVYGEGGEAVTKRTPAGQTRKVTEQAPPLVNLSPEARAHFEKYFSGVDEAADVTGDIAKTVPVKAVAEPVGRSVPAVANAVSRAITPDDVDAIVRLASEGNAPEQIHAGLKGLGLADVERVVEQNAKEIDDLAQGHQWYPSRAPAATASADAATAAARTVTPDDIDDIVRLASEGNTPEQIHAAVKGLGLADVEKVVEQNAREIDDLAKGHEWYPSRAPEKATLENVAEPVKKIAQGDIAAPSTQTIPAPPPKEMASEIPATAAWSQAHALDAAQAVLGGKVPFVMAAGIKEGVKAGAINNAEDVAKYVQQSQAKATKAPAAKTDIPGPAPKTEAPAAKAKAPSIPPPPPKSPQVAQSMTDDALPPRLRDVGRKLLEDKPLSAAEETLKTPEVEHVVNALRSTIDKTYNEAAGLGMVDPHFKIDEVYSARYSANAAYHNAIKGKKGKASVPGFWQWIEDLTKRKAVDKREGGKVMSSYSPSDIARDERFKHWQEGTTGINKAVRQWAHKPADDSMKKFLGNALDKVPDETAAAFNERVNKVADFLHRLPDDLRKSDAPDFFPRDIVNDVHTYAQYMTRKIAAGGIIHRLFAKGAAIGGEGTSLVEAMAQSLPGWPKKIGGKADKAADAAKTARENEILGTFLKDNADILKSKGIESVDDLRKATVPASDVADVTRYVKYDTPAGLPELQPFLRTIDQITDITKKGLTVPWPAFHVRNFTSGQFANLVSGTFDPNAVKKANDLWWGKNLSAKDKELLNEIAVYKIADPSHGTRGIGNSVTEQAKEIQDITPKTGKGAYERQLFRVQSADNLSSSLPKFAQKAQAAGQVSAEYVEYLNRVGQFIALRKKGWAPRAAMEKVNETHHIYSEQSRFNKNVGSRLIPFLSFASANLPWTLNELMHRPGGPLGKVIRGAKVAQEDAYVPDYVGNGVVVPVGESDDGKSYRFLSGLGLPIEEAFDRFDPSSVRRTVDNHLSMLNPLAKLPIELWAGKQLFSGKDLKDLHPFPTGNTVADQVLFNSPAARAISAGRTLADDRKGPLTKAMNLLTGARVTDVDLAKAQEIAKKRELNALLSQSPNIYESSQFGAKKDAVLTPEEEALLAEWKAGRKKKKSITAAEMNGMR